VKKVRVLVFPCASEIGLEINKSLRFVKTIELFGATSNQTDFGSVVYKNYLTNVHFINQPEFQEAFNKLLIENGIDYIFPAYDDVIVKLARMKKENNLCANLIAPDFSVCEI
jgi:hypothetical protein